MYRFGIVCSYDSNILEMIKELLLIGIIVIVLAVIVWRWVSGIDYMHKNHPNYKGNDLFGEDE